MSTAPKPRVNFGRVGGTPAAIAGELAQLERAQRDGDDSDATRVLLADWRAVQRAQRAIVADE